MRRYLIVSGSVLLIGLIAVYVWNPFRSPTWNPVSRLLGWQLMRVPSRAMEPTIPADSIVRVCYPAGNVRVGDIVMFRYRNPTELRIGEVVLDPKGSESLQLKRVAGVSGSIVVISDTGVEVDGSPVKWFVVGAGGAIGAGQYSVPDEAIFVLGDNLPASRDSRYIGPVPLDNVVGRLCDAA